MPTPSAPGMAERSRATHARPDSLLQNRGQSPSRAHRAARRIRKPGAHPPERTNPPCAGRARTRSTGPLVSGADCQVRRCAAWPGEVAILDGRAGVHAAATALQFIATCDYLANSSLTASV